MTFEATVLLETFIQKNAAILVAHPLDDRVLQLRHAIEPCIDADLLMLPDVVNKLDRALIDDPIFDHLACEAVLVRRCRLDDLILLIHSQLDLLLTIDERFDVASPFKIKDQVVPFGASDFAVMLKLPLESGILLINQCESKSVSLEQSL